MKVSLADRMARIPGPLSEQWPGGERYALGCSHGSMSVGVHAPVGRDPQTPHDCDEPYIIHDGTDESVIG